jgi:hypothetical protein
MVRSLEGTRCFFRLFYATPARAGCEALHIRSNFSKIFGMPPGAF